MRSFQEYSADVDRQIFGEDNFAEMETAIPVAFVSRVDAQLSVNPVVREIFSQNPEGLEKILAIVEGGAEGSSLLVSTPRDVTFWDRIRNREIVCEGIAHYASRSELELLAKAA